MQDRHPAARMQHYAGCDTGSPLPIGVSSRSAMPSFTVTGKDQWAEHSDDVRWPLGLSAASSSACCRGAAYDSPVGIFLAQ